MGIDKLILENWPKDVPQDCTNLLNDLDCLERNLSEPCLSCKTWIALDKAFETT